MTESLAIVSYFKDEAHVMNEWLMHHLSMGVSHFYMLDNGSRDDSLAILGEYEHCVTIVDASSLRQVDAYFRGYDLAKDNHEWVMFLDMDEFVFIDFADTTIPSFLESIERRIWEVRVNWKVFLPNCAYQPKSLIASNTKAATIDKVSILPYKTIIRTEVPIKDIRIHGPKIDRDYPRTTFYVEDGPLRVNHYRFQSYEYLLGVKLPRGGGTDKTKYQLKGVQQLLNAYLSTSIHDCEILKSNSSGLIKKIQSQTQISPSTKHYESPEWEFLKSRFPPLPTTTLISDPRGLYEDIMNGLKNYMTES